MRQSYHEHIPIWAKKATSIKPRLNDPDSESSQGADSNYEVYTNDLMPVLYFRFQVSDYRLTSQSAINAGMIMKILASGAHVKFMRDLTRGGLATTLNEIVNTQKYGIVIEEQAIPVNEGVRALCEILGYDPLYIANEGKVVIVVSAHDAERVYDILKEDSLGRDAAIIGEVVIEPKGKVCLKTVIGGTRVIDMLVGDQLPRIC